MHANRAAGAAFTVTPYPMDLYSLPIMHDSLFSHTFVASAVLALAASALFADPSTKPSLSDPAGNGWDASFFSYKRADALAVEETTPTRDQADWQRRPAKLTVAQKPPAATRGP